MAFKLRILGIEPTRTSLLIKLIESAKLPIIHKLIQKIFQNQAILNFYLTEWAPCQSIMHTNTYPSWIRIVQIGLGVLTIALSLFALAFPVVTYITIVWILAVVLFFVGIEQIIIGIFSARRSRWSTCSNFCSHSNIISGCCSYNHNSLVSRSL